jgi:hypothetical protein
MGMVPEDILAVGWQITALHHADGKVSCTRRVTSYTAANKGPESVPAHSLHTFKRRTRSVGRPPRAGARSNEYIDTEISF